MKMLRHASSPWYPFMFGLLLGTWGVWLLLPGSSYDVTHGFDYLRTVIGETKLGAIATVIGFTQVIGVLKQWLKLVQVTAYLSFFFWLMLGISFYIGDKSAVGVVIYFWLAIMSGFGYVNFKLNRTK